MQIKTIEYSKVFNLGNYSNEKIGVIIEIASGEDPLDAFTEAKKQVEKGHNFFKDLPRYEAAKKAVQNPDDFTGREVKASEEVIAAFEANYPDYLSKFYTPVSRQLTESPHSSNEDFED